MIPVGVAIEKRSLQTTRSWLLRLLLLRWLGGTEQTGSQSPRLRLLALSVTEQRSASTLRGRVLASAEQRAARASVTEQAWLLLLLVLGGTSTEQAASSSRLVLGITKTAEWASAGTRARGRRAEKTRLRLLLLLGTTSKKAPSGSSLLSPGSEKRTTGVLLLVLLSVLPKEGRTGSATTSEETTASGWLLLSARAETTATTAKQSPLVLSLILGAKAASATAKRTGSRLLSTAKRRSSGRSASKRAG